MVDDSVKLFKEALKVFNTPAVVQRWLITPNNELNNKAPLELLKTENGFERACSVLKKS